MLYLHLYLYYYFFFPPLPTKSFHRNTLLPSSFSSFIFVIFLLRHWSFRLPFKQVKKCAIHYLQARPTSPPASHTSSRSQSTLAPHWSNG